MRSPVIASLASLLLLLPSVPSAVAEPQPSKPAAASAATGADSAAIADMDSLLQSFVENGRLSCVAGFVAKGGTVVYQKAFGWRDVENRVPATVDDYYVLFSQTKAVTTVAFMTLVEQGLVAIDDPVSKYFPGIPDRVLTKVNPDGTYETRPVAAPMTFAHLMSHTSGLGAGLVHELRRAQGAPDSAPAGFGGALPQPAPAGQHTGGGNYQAKLLEEEMLALARYPLGFDPGTRWEYHLSSNMLGYLVERISGKPLREYVKEKVLTPLGMDRTDWYYAPADLARFVKPYRSVDGKLVPGPNLYAEGAVSTQQTYAEGAIGLNGPIGDYARFCQMLLNKGELDGHRILKPETVELMTTLDRLAPDSGAAPGFQFGLGFELHRALKPVPAVSDRAFSWGGMFGTKYLIDPAHDLVALYYINMYQPPDLLPQFLAQAYRLAAPASTPPGASDTAAVVVEQGGTGPYPAVATEEPTLPGMTLFRPRDLTPFGAANRLPVLLWGNGACANTAQEHKNFLNELASHGYLVLAIGRLDQLEHRDEASRQPTRSDQLLAALDWITAENAAATGRYAGRVDTAQVAAMGMSCGGLQAIEISGDPRIRTSVICNSGVLPEPSQMKLMPALTKDDLRDFHAPVLYIMGGPTDIAYNNAMDDFARLDHVPVAMTNLDVGHGGTYARPHGGEFTPVALAWLDWQLKGRAEASGMFLGEDSELARDPRWSIQLKGFPSP